MQEGPVTKGEQTNFGEWSTILSNRLMVNRNFHYYVRESGLTDQLTQATEQIVVRIARLMGLSDADPQTPSKVVQELHIDLNGPLNPPPVVIEEVDPQLEVPEVEGVECGDVSCSGELTEASCACPGPQKVTPRPVAESPLQVVFWNANAWNAQKCEQILETVRISGADLICISDARLDSHGRSYI